MEGFMHALRDIGLLMVGATPGVTARTTERARYVRAGDVHQDGKITAVGDGAAPTRGRHARLAVGDVVLRSRGAPAAAVVDAHSAGAYASNDMLIFRSDQTQVDPTYVAAFLNLPGTRDTLAAATQGTSPPRLSVQSLGALQVRVPSLEQQRRIAALAECMRAEQGVLEKLRELRGQLNQQILQRLLENAHDEGGNPRRGSHQIDLPEGRPVSPHL
jgi:hypothetical protein